MKEYLVKRYWGFGAGDLGASPQPLSTGEGLVRLIVAESRLPYETGNKEIWEVLKYRARENRQSQTEAERILWQALRASKLGHKIRRQHPIDIYIVDFICVIKRVCIEVDGVYHLEPDQIQYDEQRTFILAQKGFRVVRFTNFEVESNLQEVLNKIKVLLDSLPDVPY